MTTVSINTSTKSCLLNNFIIYSFGIFANYDFPKILAFLITKSIFNLRNNKENSSLVVKIHIAFLSHPLAQLAVKEIDLFSLIYSV